MTYKVILFLLLAVVTPEVVTGATVLDTFTPIPRYDRDKPRWEVRAVALPWVTYNYSYFNLLLPGDHPDASMYNNTQEYLLNDGRIVELTEFYGSRSNELYDLFNDSRTFGMYAFSGEVVHHRPGGIRLSLGVNIFREPTARNIDYEALDDFVDDGSYVLFNDGFYHFGHGFLGIQYTINRRKRFRIHVGAGLMVMVLETYSRKREIYGGEDPQLHFVSETVTRNTGLIYALPIPQLTFEYAVNNHLSISLGGGLTTGLGLGYRL